MQQIGHLGVEGRPQSEPAERNQRIDVGRGCVGWLGRQRVTELADERIGDPRHGLTDQPRHS